MDETARQKKIEAGKLKLAKYRKKQKKAALQKSPNGSDASIPSSKSEGSITENIFETLDEKEVKNGTMSQDVARVPSALGVSSQSNCDLPINDQFNIEQITDPEDWSTTDDFNIIQLYGNKIQQYQNALKERDCLISQLSFRLETAIEAQNVIQSQRDADVEAMIRELNSYKLQIKQINEILTKQKVKNGISAEEFMTAQERIAVLEENEGLSQKLVETERRLKGLRDRKEGLIPPSDKQVLDERPDCLDKNIQVQLDADSGIDDVVVKMEQRSPLRVPADIGVQTDPLEDLGAVPSIQERLLSHYPTDGIESNELRDIIMRTSEASVPTNHDPVSSEHGETCARDLHQRLITESNVSLKKSLNRIVCINNIAKTVNYLLGGLNVQRRLQNWSVSSSKYQFSSSEMSDAAERTGSQRNAWPNTTQVSQNDESVEMGRDMELTKNLTSLRDYLQVEMDSSFSQFNMQLEESKCQELWKSESSDESFGVNGFARNVNNDSAVANLRSSSAAVAQELASFASHIEELTDRVNDIKNQTLELKKTSLNVSFPDDESIFLEELPFSGMSMVSLPGSETAESTDSFDDDDVNAIDSKLPSQQEKEDRKGISSGHLYTIHEEAIEEQIPLSKHEKLIEELKTRHVTDIESIKRSIERDHACEKDHLLERMQVLEQQNHGGLQILESLQLQLTSQLENVEQNHELRMNEKIDKLVHLKDKVISLTQVLECKHRKDIDNLREEIEGKFHGEKRELLSVIGSLEDKLTVSKSELSKYKDETVEIECYWKNKIADLVAEHNQDLENEREKLKASLQLKQKVFEEEKIQVIEELTAAHQKKIEEIEENVHRCVLDKTLEVKEDFDRTLLSEKAKHTQEINGYQKRVEALLEEKCQLLEKSKEECELIVSRNQQALRELYQFIRNQISQKMAAIDSHKSDESSLESSFIETLNDLNQNIQNGIDSFFQQKLIDGDLDISASDKSFEGDPKWPATNTPIHPMTVTEMQQIIDMVKEESQGKIDALKEEHQKYIEELKTDMHSNFDCGRIRVLDQIDSLKRGFEQQLATCRRENEKLSEQLEVVTSKRELLEECNEKLKLQLQEVEAKCSANTAELESSSVRTSITRQALLSPDMRSWQVQAAQTNSRLLHVLSDLVKTFMDIEQNINMRLTEFGLSGNPSEMLAHHDDDTGQSVGSREDFTGIGIGESHLELHEDGPDLTPRAWDLFAAMGAYDADTEGEDVIISTSRRVRLAVDHVLNLLSLAFDKHKDQDFKSLLKRNEDLSHELQEECQDRDNLQMDLVDAKSIIRKCEAEKHKMEDENFHLSEEKSALSEEIGTLKLKISQLEDERERTYEQKKNLRQQLDLLTSRLGDPQKLPSCNENLSREVPELLQENTRLSSEKVSIQKSLGKERQNLLSRVQHLELSVEELTTEREDLVEKSRRETEDLKSQIESIEKQLQSNRKFINEQAVEREQEREESIKEIKKLQGLLREREKVQIIENQNRREAEALEQQLKVKIEEHKVLTVRKEEVERDLRQALDENHHLRDIMVELEKQLENKSRNEVSLKQKLGSVLKSLSVHEKCNEDLKNQLEECASSPVADESVEKLQNLKEQLASKSQELEQMAQSETLLRELRGQIHFLEAKVDQKIRKIESLQLVSHITSPVMSDDASHSGSHDVEMHQVPCDDGFEMSPRSVHWLEIRRLEEKVCLLIHIEEEVVKQNKEMTSQLKKLHVVEEELSHEKQALHKQSMDQLLQISALKSHIDELRHRFQPSVSTQALADIEKLRDSLQNVQDQYKSSLREVKDLREQIYSLELELQSKNHFIQKLQNERHVLCDNVQKSTQTDTDQLLPVSTQEHGQSLVHVSQLEQEMEQLHQKLSLVQCDVSRKDEVIRQLKSRVVELEGSTQKAQAELKIEQKQLEKDFDTVQDMMQKKENELCTLQEETENQLRLEASIDSLQKQVEELKSVEEKLSEKVKSLEEELEEEKQSHSHDVDMWQKKTDEISQRYAKEQAVLRRQIAALKSDVFSSTDFDDVEIKQIQEKIVHAAENLNSSREDSHDLFKQIVYRILEEAVRMKVNVLKKQNQIEIESIHSNWSEKLKEDSIRLRQHSKDQFKKDWVSMQKKQKQDMQEYRNLLKQQHADEMQKHLEEKDRYWQEKLKQTEASLLSDREKIRSLLSIDSELSREVAKKIEEVKKTFEETLNKEVGELKNLIDRITSEKESNEEMLKAMHKREKAFLMKEMEHKLIFAQQQEKVRFNEQKQALENSYQKQIHELQQELNAKLNEERQKLHQQRQQEMQAIQEIFQKQRESQVEKFQQISQDLLRGYKEDKDKDMGETLNHFRQIYEEKLKTMQNECAAKISEERVQNFAHRQAELQNLQKELEVKFEKEKLDLLEARERQMRAELQQQQCDREFLEKVESRELEDLAKNMKSLEENWQRKVISLKTSHKAEVALLKQNFEFQLQAQKEHLKKVREDNMRELQECFNRKLNNANEIIKALKSTSVTPQMDYMRASSSEVNNSSDETCSSCIHDRSLSNQDRLVKKLYNNTADVLALSEKASGQVTSAELQPLLDERTWIISRVKPILQPDEHEHELRYMIDKIVEEIQISRKTLTSIRVRDTRLSEQIAELQEQISSRNSEICLKLDQQSTINSHLESMLGVIRDSIPSLKVSETNATHTWPTNSTGGPFLSSVENPRSAYPQRSFGFPSLALEPSGSSPCLFERTDPSKIERLQTAIFERDRIISQLSFRLESAEKGQWISPTLDSKTTVPKLISTSTPLDKATLNHGPNEEDCRITLSKAASAKDTSESVSSQFHCLIYKYRRCNTYRKALIFQKKYLLSLLSGFQATEEMTLTILREMGVSVSKYRELSFTSYAARNEKPRGCALFRSASFAIMAITRMKYISSKWKKAAVVPAPHIIEGEVQNLIGDHPLMHPVRDTDFAVHCSASSTPSVEDDDAAKRYRFANRASRENLIRQLSTTGMEPLGEYVTRIQALHQKLGILKKS